VFHLVIFMTVEVEGLRLVYDNTARAFQMKFSLNIHIHSAAAATITAGISTTSLWVTSKNQPISFMSDGFLSATAAACSSWDPFKETSAPYRGKSEH
jgi:hypothetical protein